MARNGHDEEDGWKVSGTTSQGGVKPEDQLQIHERAVEWSLVPQYRSVVETAHSVEDVFKSLVNAKNNDRLRVVSKTNVAADASLKQALYWNTIFTECLESGNTGTWISYRTIECPW